MGYIGETQPQLQPKNKIPFFVVTRDPRLPYLSWMQKKHLRSMTQDPYVREEFLQPLLLAYKRQTNLADILIRAKIPPSRKNYIQNKDKMARQDLNNIVLYVNISK